ncbi:hypothetical protein [Anaerotignum neopropionicum]|nr:hypothetical protein [Anaerotignum neopropionicum]
MGQVQEGGYLISSPSQCEEKAMFKAAGLPRTERLSVWVFR